MAVRTWQACVCVPPLRAAPSPRLLQVFAKRIAEQQGEVEALQVELDASNARRAQAAQVSGKLGPFDMAVILAMRDDMSNPPAPPLLRPPLRTMLL